MSEADTQPVAPATEAAAAPAAEAASAQNEAPSLDALLQEYTAETAKPQPAPEPAKSAASNDEIAALRREVQEMKFKDEFGPVLNRIRGDIPKDVLDDTELEDILQGKARRDQRIAQAWLEKQANPQKWAKIEKALNADLSKRLQARVDANATADSEAVVASAMRGTSTKAPETPPPNYGAMNDAQFAAEKAKYGL